MCERQILSRALSASALAGMLQLSFLRAPPLL